MKLYLGIASLFLGCFAGVSAAQGAPGTVPLTPHTAEYKVKISVLGGWRRSSRRPTMVIEADP